MIHALVAAVLVAAAAPTERPKLIVLDLTAAGGVPTEVASAMTEAITTELAGKKIFDVVSSKDFQTLLGMERQKAALGCAADSGSCLSELAGALGAKFVLSGSLAKLGDTYQLSLQTLDSTRAQPMGRSTRLAKDLATLRAQLGYAVAEATATPPPAPPSHVLSYSLIGGGGAVLIGAGLLELKATSDEAALRQELQLASAQPSLLSPAATYQKRIDSVNAFKTGALVSAVVGAALVGVGILINPSDAGTSGAQVALYPGGFGIAYAGVLP